MEKQEFTVTGPGEYRARSGKKVTIVSVAGSETHPFLDSTGRSYQLSGRYLYDADVSQSDIVGPWVVPATLDAVRAGVLAGAEAGPIAGADTSATSLMPPGPTIEEAAVMEGRAERVPTPGPMAFALGQTWRTRGGYLVVIDQHDEPDTHVPWRSARVDNPDDFRWHSVDGKASSEERDLVELVSHPAEPDEPLIIDAAAAHLEGLRAGQVVDAGFVEPKSVEAYAVETIERVGARVEEHFGAAEGRPVNAATAHLDWSAVPTGHLPVADPDAEEEPTDYRECAEVLAAALRVLCDAVDASIPQGAHGLKLEDARRLATVALDGYAP